MSTLAELKKLRNMGASKDVNKKTTQLTVEQLHLAIEDQLAIVLSYSEQIDEKYAMLTRVQEQRSVAYATESVDNLIALESNILESIGKLFANIWNAICSFFKWIVSSFKKMWIKDEPAPEANAKVTIANITTTELNRLSLFNKLIPVLGRYNCSVIEFINHSTSFEVKPGVKLDDDIEHMLHDINATVVRMTELLAAKNPLGDSVENHTKHIAKFNGKYLVKSSYVSTTETDFVCDMQYKEVTLSKADNGLGIEISVSDAVSDPVSVKLNETTTQSTDSIHAEMLAHIRLLKNRNVLHGINTLDGNVDKLYRVGKAFENAAPGSVPATDPDKVKEQMALQKVNKDNMVALAKFMHLNYGQVVVLGMLYKNLLR